MGNMRGGFGGGGFNMQNLMKQAQKMQENMQKANEELENCEIEATVGGGMVTVVVTGKKRVKQVKLKKEAVDPDDIEMLEDLLVAGFNEACAKADEKASELMPANLNGLM